jgi:hypothetical protein
VRAKNIRSIFTHQRHQWGVKPSAHLVSCGDSSVGIGTEPRCRIMRGSSNAYKGAKRGKVAEIAASFMRRDLVDSIECFFDKLSF